MKSIQISAVFLVFLLCFQGGLGGLLISKLTEVRKDVKCKLHQIGSLVISHNHHNERCEDQEETVVNGQHPTVSGTDNGSQNLYNGNNANIGSGNDVSKSPGENFGNPEDQKQREDQNIIYYPEIDIRNNKNGQSSAGSTTSTSTEYPTVPGGKRLLKVGSNCPEGQIYVDGECKEEF